MGRIGSVEIGKEHIGCTVMYFPDHTINHFFHSDIKLGVIQSFNNNGVEVRFVEGSHFVPFENLIFYYGSKSNHH